MANIPTSEQVPSGPFLVKQGIDYRFGRRAEVGDVVDDLPAGSIPWLLADGVIEPVNSSEAEGQEVIVDAE
ncbi:MAG TPA: hypothetical protein VF914_21020 [Chloroflexia bacterium]|jgi:hypothetical protein